MLVANANTSKRRLQGGIELRPSVAAAGHSAWGRERIAWQSGGDLGGRWLPYTPAGVEPSRDLVDLRCLYGRDPQPVLRAPVATCRHQVSSDGKINQEGP